MKKLAEENASAQPGYLSIFDFFTFVEALNVMFTDKLSLQTGAEVRTGKERRGTQIESELWEQIERPTVHTQTHTHIQISNNKTV